MRTWLVAAGLALIGASAASAADYRLPPPHRHVTYLRPAATPHACPIGKIDDRGAVVDGIALGLTPPPRGYCWYHWGGELRLEALASGRIILRHQAF